MNLQNSRFRKGAAASLILSFALLSNLRGTEPPAAPAKPPAEAPLSPDPGQKLAYRNVGVEEFAKLRETAGSVVLDVRTAKEFKAGHIPGSVNLDFHASDFKEKLEALDKRKTYLVHCAAGVRSAKACGLMGTIEFKNLVNLEGGFRAWEAKGKPVEH